VTAFAMERIPRTSRAQKMDALSSMSTIAGYRAMLIAAGAAPRFFPLLMTAAGTIAPARVFVLGAGVAGLQCIATARRLGAVVEAFDVRPAVKDEVQSLGATFVGLELLSAEAVTAGGYAKETSEEHQAKQRAFLGQRMKACDVVVTTAMVASGRAPVLVTRDMVEGMKPGSVIVDLAADGGGNCELTRPGEVVMHRGVAIHGPVNLAATLPIHASQMYSRNVQALVLHLVKDGKWNLDFNDDIVRDTCLVRGSAAPAEAVSAGASS
jgi:NAD(P) transhydrogenase subunit alpha